MPTDWDIQRRIAANEADAELQAQYLLVSTTVDAIARAGNAHLYAAQNNYYTDADIGIREAGTRSGAASLESQGQLQATSIVTAGRSLSVLSLMNAQSDAAGSLSKARIQSEYDLVSARVSAATQTEGQDLLSAQQLSAARLAASTATSAAQVAAATAEVSARITSYGLDSTTRKQVATIHAVAALSAATEESNAHVTARQTVTLAQTAAATTVANARIAAEAKTTAARITAVVSTSDASILAAQLKADAEIYSEEEGASASLESDRIIVAARLTALGLSADRQVADIESSADFYSSDRQLEGRKYAATSELAAGVYSADQGKAGDIYQATGGATGITYAADRELAGYVYQSNTEAAARRYVAQRHLDEANYSGLADENRLEMKIGYEGSLISTVWPYIQTVLALVPPVTPGLILDLPAMEGVGALGRVEEDSVVAALDAAAAKLASSSGAKAANRLSRLGYATSAQALVVTSLGYVMSGIQSSIGSEGEFRLGCLEANGTTLTKQQAAIVDVIAKQQSVLADAADNLYRRQVGLVAGVARINAV
jgi:hypothetical protein